MHNERNSSNIILVAMGAICTIILIAVWMGSEESLKVVSAEDGVIESLSAIFYLCGFVICVSRLITHKDKNKLLLYLWAFLCFFFLGEETSWFQRVFNYSTPSSVESINAQEEFNFHNLDFFQGGSWVEGVSSKKINIKLFFGSQNLFRLGFFIYFLVVPILAHFGWLKWLRRKFDYKIPSLTFLVAVWVPIIISFVLAAYSDGLTKSSIAETREMFYAFSVLLYVYLYTSIAFDKSTENS